MSLWNPKCIQNSLFLLPLFPPLCWRLCASPKQNRLDIQFHAALSHTIHYSEVTVYCRIWPCKCFVQPFCVVFERPCHFFLSFFFFFAFPRPLVIRHSSLSSAEIWRTSFTLWKIHLCAPCELDKKINTTVNIKSANREKQQRVCLRAPLKLTNWCFYILFVLSRGEDCFLAGHIGFLQSLLVSCQPHSDNTTLGRNSFRPRNSPAHKSTTYHFHTSVFVWIKNTRCNVLICEF